MNLFRLTSWIPTDMNISRVRMTMRRTGFSGSRSRQNFDKYVLPYILSLLLIRAGIEQNPGPSYICPKCQTNLDAARQHCLPPATAGFIFSVVDSRT